MYMKTKLHSLVLINVYKTSKRKKTMIEYTRYRELRAN